MKEHRKEEKQRRAIAEARKRAEKFGTENLIEGLPLQADFPMQETKQEQDKLIEENLNRTMYLFERINRCAVSGLHEGSGGMRQA